MPRRFGYLRPVKKIKAKFVIDKKTGKLVQVGLGVTTAALTVGVVDKMLGRFK